MPAPPAPAEAATAPASVTAPQADQAPAGQVLASAQVTTAEPPPPAQPAAPLAKAVVSAGGGIPKPSPPVRDSQALWREELSGRVQEFRQRRARLRRGFDPTVTLDLDFNSAQGTQGGEMDQQDDDFAGGFAEAESRLGPPPEHSATEQAAIDAVALERAAGGIRVLSGAAVEAGELTLGHHDAAPEPVEIILDSSRPFGQESETGASRLAEPRALIGRRFLAGLGDALILLLGDAVFGGIFWYLAGRGGGVSFRPANVAAMGSIAAFLMFFYFGMSVALTATTPGLAWLGLEVRNLEGNLPSARESLARAFGYLVSVSALFLGFAWAIFDADGLTWHDLISGTYVTERS